MWWQRNRPITGAKGSHNPSDGQGSLFHDVSFHENKCYLLLRSGYISIDEYVQFMVMSARKSTIASKTELINSFKSMTSTGDREYILPRELREHLSSQASVLTFSIVLGRLQTGFHKKDQGFMEASTPGHLISSSEEGWYQWTFELVNGQNRLA